MKEIYMKKKKIKLVNGIIELKHQDEQLDEIHKGVGKIKTRGKNGWYWYK